MSNDEHDFLPGYSWVISTHPQLKEHLTRLTPEKLDEVCPQLKEWRERAIELQGEPAVMAVGIMQLTEERDQWKAAAQQLRIIGADLCITARDYGQSSSFKSEIPSSVRELCDLWDLALTDAPWQSATRHLYQNSEVIYCAESLDQCWALFESDTGMTRSEDEEHDPFVQIPDDKPLEVGSEDPTGEPGEVERTHQLKPGTHGTAPTFWYVTKTATEWAAGFAPGHFSGGDY